MTASELPFVTILRPVKGYDPNLVVCLTSTCLLEYPVSRYELVLCVASPQDSAIPAIREVIDQNPDTSIRLLIGEEDIGPNPKIRNLSRGYREAKGDIVWILDCNVWVPPGILQRSVRLLEGTAGEPGYKLVHHLPLCVDVTNFTEDEEQSSSPSLLDASSQPLLSDQNPVFHGPFWSRWLSYGGGRLEESFLSSSHAKFYCAINTVAVAPCIIGKSNMFRRSHLAEATRHPGDRDRPSGIAYFAENICEDHLLAERLWVTRLQDEQSGRRQWRKHGLGKDLVFQPVQRMSVLEYISRRVRWIRVRKYSVLAATIVEAGTECFVCSLMGAYAVTTLPGLRVMIGQTRTAFWVAWLFSVLSWALIDRLLFRFLHEYRATATNVHSPQFVLERPGRELLEWAYQWTGREMLALPIWLWAMWPGWVDWRGGRYRVRWKDLKVEEDDREGAKID